MQTIAPNTLDTFGRKFPGNPAAAENENYVLCNNDAPADWTRVTGQAVAKLVELRDGDRIQLGNVVLRFQMRAAQVRAKGRGGR